MAGKYEVYSVSPDSPDQPQQKYQVFNQQPLPGTQFDTRTGQPVVKGEQYRKEQSWPSYVTDLAAIGLAGPVEFFSELPGGIASLVQNVGNRITGYKPKEGERLHGVAGQGLISKLPLPGEVGQKLSELTGGRTEPKTEWEQSYKDIMANFATLVAPEAFGKQVTPYSTGVNLAKAVGSEGTRKLIQEFRGGPAAQAVGQALFMSAANTPGTRKLLTQESAKLREEINPILQTTRGNARDEITALKEYKAKLIKDNARDKDFIIERIDAALAQFESPFVQETERQVIQNIEQGQYPTTGKAGNPHTRLGNLREHAGETHASQSSTIGGHPESTGMKTRTGGFEGEPIRVDRVKSQRVKDVVPITKEEIPLSEIASHRTSLGQFYDDPKLSGAARKGLDRVYATLSGIIEKGLSGNPEALEKWKRATDIDRGLLSASVVTRLLEAASTLDPRKFDIKSLTAKGLLYGSSIAAGGVGTGGLKAIAGALVGSNVAHQFSRSIDFLASSKTAQQTYRQYAAAGLRRDIPMFLKQILKLDKEALEYDKKSRKERTPRIRVGR